MNYHYTFVSKKGFKRLENEDSVGVYNVEGGILAIVCDGLGGQQGGEVASSLTVDTIVKFFLKSKVTNYLDRIKFSIRKANKVVLKRSLENPLLKGMATTVEVLFLKDQYVYWGHIGDSRIYTLKNKKLHQITKDHSLVQKMIDEGNLSIHDAVTHPNRNIITRAVGENSTIEVDLSKIKISENDSRIFFICTDGVTNEINDRELERILNLPEPENISKKIIRLIESRSARDNFSFVIFSKG